MEFEEIEKKYTKLLTYRKLVWWGLGNMVLAGFIAMAGDFISWDLWDDYVLLSDYDLRFITTMVGVGWTLVNGVVWIVVFCRSAFYSLSDEEYRILYQIKGDEGVDKMKGSKKSGVIWTIIAATIGIIIVIIGNLSMWKACPRDETARGQIPKQIEKVFPGSEVSIRKWSKNEEELSIRFPNPEEYYVYRGLDIDFMMNTNKLDPENITFSGDYDSRVCTADQIISEMEGYLTGVPDQVFEEGNLSYLVPELSEVETQIIQKFENPEDEEDYEDNWDLMVGEDEVSLYVEVSDDIITPYEGNPYKSIRVYIHTINFRW